MHRGEPTLTTMSTLSSRFEDVLAVGAKQNAKKKMSSDEGIIMASQPTNAPLKRLSKGPKAKHSSPNPQRRSNRSPAKLTEEKILELDPFARMRYLMSLGEDKEYKQLMGDLKKRYS